MEPQETQGRDWLGDWSGEGPAQAREELGSQLVSLKESLSSPKPKGRHNKGQRFIVCALERSPHFQQAGAGTQR